MKSRSRDFNLIRTLWHQRKPQENNNYLYHNTCTLVTRSTPFDVTIKELCEAQFYEEGLDVLESQRPLAPEMRPILDQDIRLNSEGS